MQKENPRRLVHRGEILADKSTPDFSHMGAGMIQPGARRLSIALPHSGQRASKARPGAALAPPPPHVNPNSSASACVVTSMPPQSLVFKVATDELPALKTGRQKAFCPVAEGHVPSICPTPLPQKKNPRRKLAHRRRGTPRSPTCISRRGEVCYGIVNIHTPAPLVKWR